MTLTDAERHARRVAARRAHRRRQVRRRRATFLACVALLVIGVTSLVRGSGGGGTAVAVFPSAGTSVASPRTQISFRGVAPAGLGRVTVTGSRSGRHAGRLAAHSDGRGASFLPARPFAVGERVEVRASGADLLGARDGAVRFRVGAMPEPHRDPVAPANPRRLGVQQFVTRPDLSPPAIAVDQDRGAAPGDVFVAPKVGDSQWGPMILDAHGRTVWFDPLPHSMQGYDFRMQTYRGKPVLTWWQGRFALSHGDGEDVIADTSYRRVATVRAGNAFQTDAHEFELTPRGTALVTAYVAQPRDLRAFGGSAHGRVLDGVVQEIDVRTGLVLFEWHSLDHVPLSDSYMAVPSGSAQWDYFHLNSVDELPDGNLLISARHTQQLYEVDRRTGAVVWRMGGQHSDFRFGRGAGFAWQHDAQGRADGTITVFDNATGSRTPNAPRSRALQLRISGRSVDLVRSWHHTPGLTSSTQGNVELMPGGDVFVGWGIAGVASEYSRDGAVRFDAHFASPGAESYRSYKLPWHARPPGRPSVVANATTAWVSWNGATDVATWRVLGGASPAALSAVASARWSGLETQIALPAGQTYVAVEAVSAKGKVLGSSLPVAVG